jgi:D-sedoheptulose 7-phosphate isomerase
MSSDKLSTESFVDMFLQETREILSRISRDQSESLIAILLEVKREGGRVFFAGSGGGAGHSSHAACDFRKILNIESYSISDNVSELTARVNDESWADSYANWLRVSRISKSDCLFVMSVGGGSIEKEISMNLVNAMKLTKESGGRVIGIAGRDGGYLKKVADAAVIIPTLNSSTVTAQVEGLQALIWHMIIMHPILCGEVPKWESVK